MTDETDLRRELRRLIEQRCGSVNAACLAAGLDTSRVYRFFAGKRGINWSTLEALMRECGIEFCSREDAGGIT